MTSSVSPNPSVQILPTAQIEKTPQVQNNVEVENKEAAKPSLQDQFDALLMNYHDIIQVTKGCGSFQQPWLDSEHQKIVKFVEEHPKFAPQLPKKQRCRNDGTDGLATGLSMLLKASKK